MTGVARSLRLIPSGVLVLSLVSLFMDMPSEMIYSLLLLFMVTTLGTSTIMVGLVEGLAESVALIMKVFSGTLSDYLGNRKCLAVCGYALGALSKPLFAVAPGMSMVLTAHLEDRIGKGVRGAPAMRSLLTSLHQKYGEQPSACAKAWIRLAHSSDRYWPSDSCCCGSIISGQSFGWPCSQP